MSSCATRSTSCSARSSSQPSANSPPWWLRPQPARDHRQFGGGAAPRGPAQGGDRHAPGHPRRGICASQRARLHLLAYARPDRAEATTSHRPRDLAAHHDVIGPKGALEIEIFEQADQVYADPSLLRHVLDNLVDNAGHAMNWQGTSHRGAVRRSGAIPEASIFRLRTAARAWGPTSRHGPAIRFFRRALPAPGSAWRSSIASSRLTAAS